jgi:hypothetical protein
MDAMPTPTPPIHRKKINEAVDHASPHPTEHAKRKAEATKRTFFRPKLSLAVTAAKHPSMAPTIAELTNQPSIRVESLKCATIKSLAPEITNRS